MAEIIPKEAPDPRSLLGYDGTNFYVLKVDAAGHLQIDALELALPDGAGTAANQALILAQLQLIEDLRDALQSVATDRLIVRGQDQLFSFKDRFALIRTVAISGADGYIDSDTPPEGEYYVVRTACTAVAGRAATRIRLFHQHNEVAVGVHEEYRAFQAGERSCWSGMTILAHGDVIRAYITGALADDTAYADITGYVMTKET